MLNVYGKKLIGSAPQFPPELEQSIGAYLESRIVDTASNVEKPGKPKLRCDKEQDPDSLRRSAAPLGSSDCGQSLD
jgi:hypothetical protein